MPVLEVTLAKAIPKAKGKKSKLDHEKALKKLLKDLDEQTDERYAWAVKFLKGQDEKVREAVGRMVDTMKEMAGPPTANLIMPGDKQPTTVNVDESFQDRNFVYIAVRLLLAGAKMDIRVAKLKLSNRCVEPLCGRKV